MLFRSEEGAVIWKDDEKGYTREEKISRKNEWTEPVGLLEAPAQPKKSRRKAI